MARSVAAVIEQVRDVGHRLGRYYRLVGPFIALASGLMTVFLLRRGVNFAPVAAALVVFAWTLASVTERFLSSADDAPKLVRLARFLATGFVSGLYQDALFFLLPIWFLSATWPSLNAIAPI